MKLVITVPAQKWVLDIEPEDEDNRDYWYDTYIHHCLTDVDYSTSVIEDKDDEDDDE